MKHISLYHRLEELLEFREIAPPLIKPRRLIGMHIRKKRCLERLKLIR